MNQFTTEQLVTITNIVESVGAQHSDLAWARFVNNPWSCIAVIGVAFAIAWVFTTFIKHA